MWRAIPIRRAFWYTMKESERKSVMSETEREISTPHGEDQTLKMDLLAMIHSAENPFDIIYHIANYLEKKSNEAGYAQIVLQNMRTIYGVVLGEQKLLTDEIKDVETRLARIKNVLETADLTEEEASRANFAVALHQKNIKRLNTRLLEPQANNESLYFVKK